MSVPGVDNVLADLCLWSFHLTDAALLALFNSLYPTQPSWQMCHLKPMQISQLTYTLLQPTQHLALHMFRPPAIVPPGSIGASFALPSILMNTLQAWLIPSQSCNSMLITTELVKFLPCNVQCKVTWWNRHSEPLGRCFPSWGPWTHESTALVPLTFTSSANWHAMPNGTHLHLG